MPTPLPAPNARLHRWEPALFALVVAAPFVHLLWAEIAAPGLRTLPDGDFSLLELDTRRAMQCAQLVGPYSRFGWSHPGPLYFYLLAPLYALSGQASGSLHVGAILINAISALAILGHLLRRTASRTALWLSILLLVGYLGLIDQRFPPSGLSTIWNPLVTILPFVLYCFLAAGIWEGHLNRLPWAVLLATFLVQSHIGYAVIVALILGFSLAAGGRTRLRRAGWRHLVGEAKRPAGISAALSVLAWLPAVVDEWRFAPGNLAQIKNFFLETGATQDFTTVWRPVSSELGSLLVQGAGRSWPVLGDAASAALVIALAWTLLRRSRAPAPGPGLAAVALIGIAGGWLAATRIVGDAHWYLLAWISGVGFAGWAAVLEGLGQRRKVEHSPPRARAAALIVLTAALMVTLTGGSIRRARYGYADAREEVPRPITRRIMKLASEARLLVTDEEWPRVIVRLKRHELWGEMAGFLLQMEKEGKRPAMEETFVFLFDRRFFPKGSEDLELWIAGQEDVNAYLVLKRGDSYVSAGPGGTVTRLAAPGRLELVERAGVEGDPGAGSDGLTPADGSPWDVPGTVRFSGPESSLTWRVLDDTMDGLLVSADSDDEYLVEASTDGRTYGPVALILPRPGPGLRTAFVPFAGAYTTRFIRIQPRGGDGRYSLGEVIPLLSEVRRVDFGTPQARELLREGWSIDERAQSLTFVWAEGLHASLDLELEAGRSHEMRLHLAPAPDRDEPQKVRIEINGTPAGEIELSEQWSSYVVGLPGAAITARNRLDFHFAHATPPADVLDSTDRRPLAVAFDHIVLRALAD